MNKFGYCENLINSYKNKMEAWKGKWLSSARRLLVIKVVLSAILVYSMACLKLPKAVKDELILILRRFFRSDTSEQ